ncbi:MAG: DegT/DnrJ/EryC1/StrS family aminotransferase [Planctomycetaceae bacterium]
MTQSPPSVPLLDLKGQYRALKPEIDEAVQRVVDSQYFINGPEVAGLEEEIAAYCGTAHCIGVSSGSDALLAALMALNVGPGDEVLTPPFTFFATVGAIRRLGATPVFVDVDPVTYNIDPLAVAGQITPRTRAIIPVHLYGQCAEMDPILRVAEKHGIAVIEDAAQAIGAEYQGRRAGSMGTAGCFSFFPSKNLGAFGDGGAVTTNDAELAERIRILRNHGAQPKYFHKFVGGNFRLDAIHAAVLRVKLKYLDDWTASRQRNAAFYDAAFAELGLPPATLSTPVVVQHRHIFNQYVLRSRRRDELIRHLKANDIGCEVYYPLSLHEQVCFQGLGYARGDFPESERAAASTLAIPIYPELSDSQKQRVVNVVAAFHGCDAGTLSEAA